MTPALQEARKPLGAVSFDTGSLRGDLMAMLKPLADMLDRVTGRALLRAAFTESAEPSLAYLTVAQMVQEDTDPLLLLVERARSRGEWDEKIRADQLLFMVTGAMIHRAMLERAPLTKDWLSSLVDLALHGVLPRKSRR